MFDYKKNVIKYHALLLADSFPVQYNIIYIVIHFITILCIGVTFSHIFNRLEGASIT